MGKIRLTRELIHKYSSDAGGWSFAQIRILTGKSRPEKGWLRELDGKEIDEEVWEAFLEQREKDAPKVLARLEKKRQAKARKSFDANEPGSKERCPLCRTKKRYSVQYFRDGDFVKEASDLLREEVVFKFEKARDYPEVVLSISRCYCPKCLMLFVPSLVIP